MTVSSIIPVNNYTGNSYTTTFDFDFLIEAEKELIVTHIDSNGISRILKEGVDYSINEIGNKNGSYITFPLSGSTYSVLGTDEKISLSLTLDIKQESEFRNSSYFNFDILEWTFDYIVRILQILNRKIERSVKVSEGSETTPDALISELNNAKETAVLSAQSAESAKQTCSSYLTQTQQNIAYFENLVDSFSDTYEECLQDILDEGIETRADIDLSNLSSEGEKRFLNKTQVTNCILEEPDNTIYEYDDSSFTFKSGSIAIFPYGTSAPAKSIGDDLFNNGQWIITDIQYDSGKLFYWAKKQNDLTLTSWTASALSGDLMTCYEQNNSIYSPSNNYSGTSIPEGAVTGMFYNTNDNRVYRIYNGSIEEYQSNYYSFPFMILHFDNSVVPKRVKQLFKGQGYIGATRWVNKGVKLLFPNGRNSDGTLNNIEVENTKLLRLNLNNTSGYTTDYEAYLTCSYNNSNGNTVLNIGYITADRYFETDNLDEIPQEERNAIVYRPSFNDFWWYNASEDKWYERTYCITGEMYYNYSSASKILEFKPRNTFRAVDDFDLRSKLSKNALYSTVYINGTSGYREWFSDEALTNRILIEQWGTTTLSVNETKNIIFLKEFTNTNYVVFANFFPAANINVDDNPIPRVNSTTAFTLYGTESGATNWSNQQVAWRAIGV